jgi:hypothetical protein
VVVGAFHFSFFTQKPHPFLSPLLEKEEGRDRKGAWITSGGKFLFLIFHFKNLTPFFPLYLKKEEGRARKGA